MAAATVDAAEYNINLDKLHRMVGNRRRSGNDSAGITAPLVFTVPIPLTSLDDIGDKVRLAYIPAGYWMADLAVRWLAEADEHATPTHTFSILTQTLAGSEDALALISGSTSSQADDGGDRIDDAAVGLYVGGKDLVMKTTAATATAPAAAVDLRVWMVLAHGVITEGVRRVPHYQSV